MASERRSTEFGRLLREHRVAAGLTQEALALPPHEQARFESAAQPSPRRRPSTAIPEPTHLVPVPQGERTAPDNLFPSLTSFIGREEEMRRITSLLTTARLVTLTGAGGCGKTRLALQVALQNLGNYPAGSLARRAGSPGGSLTRRAKRRRGSGAPRTARSAGVNRCSSAICSPAAACSCWITAST